MDHPVYIYCNLWIITHSMEIEEREIAQKATYNMEKCIKCVKYCAFSNI